MLGGRRQGLGGGRGGLEVDKEEGKGRGKVQKEEGPKHQLSFINGKPIREREKGHHLFLFN